MEWVSDFYSKQDEWSGVYRRSVSDEDRQRVTTISRLVGPGAKRILELGAGGGQAAAAATDAGHSVVALELVPDAAAHIRSLAENRPQLHVIEGDFYTVDVPGQFDLVCYWDGFGVGSDAEQKHLMRRIAGWLAPEGCALLDIITPWYWAATAGRGWEVGTANRRYSFDGYGCRMLDTWWPGDDESQAVTQSLRCYSPADLRLLLQHTGLALESLEAGGAVDYDKHEWHPQVPLERAMSYVAKLIRKK
jgi:SAM-dependent methyltransferase